MPRSATFIAGSSAPAGRLGIPVENRLDVLAIDHELTVLLEDLVLCARQAAVLVFGFLGEVRADRVDGIADEHRLDEAQAVISVRERLQPVGRDQSDACTEDE